MQDLAGGLQAGGVAEGLLERRDEHEGVELRHQGHRAEEFGAGRRRRAGSDPGAGVRLSERLVDGLEETGPFGEHFERPPLLVECVFRPLWPDLRDLRGLRRQGGVDHGRAEHAEPVEQRGSVEHRFGGGVQGEGKAEG